MGNFTIWPLSLKLKIVKMSFDLYRIKPTIKTTAFADPKK
jgi:hypothetical protein